MGANPLNIENTIARSKTAKGVVVCEPFPNMGSIYDTNLLLVAAGSSTVIIASPDSGTTKLPEIQFPDGATVSVFAYASFVLDDQFCENEKAITLKFLIRRFGAGSDDTALGVQFIIQAMTPGDASVNTVLSSSTTAKHTPAAVVTTNTWESFEMKLHELCSATQLGYLSRGAQIIVRMAPSKTVGTDLALGIRPLPMQIRKHLHVADATDIEPRY